MPRQVTPTDETQIRELRDKAVQEVKDLSKRLGEAIARNDEKAARDWELAISRHHAAIEKYSHLLAVTARPAELGSASGIKAMMSFLEQAERRGIIRRGSIAPELRKAIQDGD